MPSLLAPLVPAVLRHLEAYAGTDTDIRLEKDAFRWQLTGGSEPGEPTAR